MKGKKKSKNTDSRYRFGFVVLKDFGSYWNITRRGTLKEDHPEETNQKKTDMANSRGTTLNASRTSKFLMLTRSIIN